MINQQTRTHACKPSDIGLLCFFRTSCAHQCVLSHRVINRLTQTHASKRLFVQHIQHWPQIIFINHGLFLFIGIHVVRLICCSTSKINFTKLLLYSICTWTEVISVNAQTTYISLVALRKQMVKGLPKCFSFNNQLDQI